MPTDSAGSVVRDAAGVRSGASFRDPSGFIFSRSGVLYRQVNQAYRADYELLFESGLYRALTSAGDLIPHDEVDVAFAGPDGWRVLRPERVPFVSYPYEWCFGQLKAAALLTLRMQRAAMNAGMSLKDATAYNVQFHRGKPVWIDTLSFERLREGRPWVAYRQFCEFFLGPLALMRHVDERLHQLLRTFIDGIPLEMVDSMLPASAWLHPGLAMHLRLHARAQRKGRMNAGAPKVAESRRMSHSSLLGLIDSLTRTVSGLTWTPSGTVWGDYYEDTNYSPAAVDHKRALVADGLDRLAPSAVWDFGANLGLFSRVASDRGIPTVAFDVDGAAVEKNYRHIVESREEHLLPLLLDVTNPSGPIGWANDERLSLLSRGPVDAILALALVHHLAIGHNVPLDRVAEFMASAGRSLVIEWVPKEDSQVQRMLASRDDVFGDYTQGSFEAAFSGPFHIEAVTRVQDSLRSIYVMRRRG